jgi:hypothetical protein
MDESLYFVDNDVIYKVCQYGLQDEFLGVYSAASDNLYILPTLKFRAYLADQSKSIKFLGSLEAYQRVTYVVSKCCEANLGDALMKEVLESDYLNIDEGELILAFCVQENAGSELLTGDKRAVVAFSQRNRFLFCQYRVQILEQIMLRILESFNFEEVRNKVLANPDVDKALTMCFRSPDAQGVCRGLNSYINNLKGENHITEMFLSRN